MSSFQWPPKGSSGGGGSITPGTTPVTGGTPYMVLDIDAGGFVNQTSVLLDTSGISSVDFWDRVLYYNDGSIVSVDWDEAGLNDIFGNSTLNWEAGQLYNSMGATVLDWNDSQLNNSTNDLVMDWGVQQLISPISNSVCLDWNHFELFDNAGAGTVRSMNWDQRILFDANDTQSANWDLRRLHDSNGDEVFEWIGTQVIGFFGTTPATQQTGGPATAGVAYTAVERGMINRMYTALQAYGLLT